MQFPTMILSAIPTLLFLILQLVPSPRALSLPLCTESWQQPQGYTFTVDPLTGEKVWSFCDFPDPRYDHAFCGLPDWSDPGFLCDPDNLIGSDEQAVLRINNDLRTIQTKTSRQCSSADGTRQGFIVAIVMVDRIRIGSPYSADSCINDCGEIYPTVNISARAPTTGELNVAMETFADGLRSGLGMGACGNDLIMMYSKTYNRVYSSMGSRVADILDSSTVSELHSRFLDYVQQGNLEQALLYVSEKLSSELRGIAPATIMLIITMISAALFLLFMVFFLHLSDTDYNAWGQDGTASKMADMGVKTLTGVYFIDWMFRATSHISSRLPLWPVIFLFVTGVACMVVFFTTDNLYTGF